MRVIINVFLVLLISTSSLFSQKTSTKQNSDGYIKNFYNNGKLESEGIMKEDFEDGLWKYYYKNGVLNEEITFKDGVMVGPFKSYNKNGKLKAEGKITIKTPFQIGS